MNKLVELINVTGDDELVMQAIPGTTLREIEDAIEHFNFQMIDARNVKEYYNALDWRNLIADEAGIPRPKERDPEAEAEQRYFDMHDDAYIRDLRGDNLDMEYEREAYYDDEGMW